jgi:alkylation response protein AidB-like acyl-CoA dehydrogenase
MITTGGSAVLLNHTVQRLYREAMLYMVTGLNNNLRDALLAELLVEERCL